MFSMAVQLRVAYWVLSNPQQAASLASPVPNLVKFRDSPSLQTYAEALYMDVKKKSRYRSTDQSVARKNLLRHLDLRRNSIAASSSTVSSVAGPSTVRSSILPAQDVPEKSQDISLVLESEDDVSDHELLEGLDFSGSQYATEIVSNVVAAAVEDPVRLPVLLPDSPVAKRPISTSRPVPLSQKRKANDALAPSKNKKKRKKKNIQARE